MLGYTRPRHFPPRGLAFIDPHHRGGAAGSSASHVDWAHLPLTREVEVAWEPGEPVSMSQCSVPRWKGPRMPQHGRGVALFGDVARTQGMHARLLPTWVEFSWFPKGPVRDRAPEQLHGLSWPRRHFSSLQSPWGLDADDLAVGAATQDPRWHGLGQASRGHGPRCWVPLALPWISVDLQREDGWVGPAVCWWCCNWHYALQPVLGPPVLDTRGAIHWQSCVPLWSCAALGGVLRTLREDSPPPESGSLREATRSGPAG